MENDGQGFEVEKELYNGYCRVVSMLGKEVVHAPDSAAVLVYCRDRRELLLIEQFRVPVKRFLVEPVAGRLDKPGLSIREILVDELRQEAGVTVCANDLVLLNDGVSLAIDPGLLACFKTLAYVEITDHQLIEGESFGDPGEDEFIKRHFIPIDKIDELRPACLTTFALLMWFKAEKLPALLANPKEAPSC